MAFTFDGPNKRIILTAGTTSVSVRDMWSRAVDWWTTSDNSKFIFPFTQVGGNDIDTASGTKIPIYLFLMDGWRIRPQEANHTLNIGDGILLVDGGGDPFVNTLESFVVRINYQQPVQAISFATDGGGTATIDYQQVTDAVWNAPLASYVSSGSFGKLLQEQGVNIMKVLGLVHQNILIDNTNYDASGNLISARVRVYSDSASVGTPNNVLATYQMNCNSSGPGKFATWSQIEVN